jgi:exodeoxyribonuclease VII large subunit
MSQPPAASDEVRTIRETNAEIRALVERETLEEKFWIGGVVRRFNQSDRGHWYFDLEDDDHTIPCMVREPIRGKLGLNIANGMDIEAFGLIRVYEKEARLQFEVQKARLTAQPSITPALAVFEQLEKQGLWPRSASRLLPDPISSIALIASKHTDAERDFYDTYHKEDGKARVKTVDVRIQGESAPREIAQAIEKVNQEKSADVIALVRGGGRNHDIAVFNEMLIVEAICRSTIPVVTGIGHQPDHTYADDVADLSTITPTMAAIQLARWPEKVSSPPPAAPTGKTPAARSFDRWILIVGAVVLIALVALILLVLLKP